MSYFLDANAQARIAENNANGGSVVTTARRDQGSLNAAANIRFRNDTITGRSLTGLEIVSSGGRITKLTGREARTLYRVLNQAVNG